MKLSRKRSMSFLILSVLLLTGTTAHAQDFRPQVGQRLSDLDVSDANVIEFTVYDGISYCCEIWANSRSEGFDNDLKLAVPNLLEPGGTLTTIARGTLQPAVSAPSAESRLCLIWDKAAGSDVGKSRFGADIATNSASSGVNILCRETSLHGGFNTSVTDFNFVEVTNTTVKASNMDSSEITVRIRARSTLSDTEVLNTSFTLAAGARRDVDLHSVAPNDFGPILISHNGPPGAIRAVNAQYRIVTTSPLDFEPVLVVPFREGRE